jgi:hypothetical protein
MLLYETITARTEKWATPTFLLVIHSAARSSELEIRFKLVKHSKVRFQEEKR